MFLERETGQNVFATFAPMVRQKYQRNSTAYASLRTSKQGAPRDQFPALACGSDRERKRVDSSRGLRWARLTAAGKGF